MKRFTVAQIRSEYPESEWVKYETAKRLEEALEAMLKDSIEDFSNKACGHDFSCACIEKQARAALAAAKEG